MERPSNKKERDTLYCGTFLGFVKCLPKRGHLIVNHVLLIVGICGCVPYWFAMEFHGNQELNGFSLLREGYGLPPGSDAAEALMDSISRAAKEQETTYPCSKRTAEKSFAKCTIYNQNQIYISKTLFCLAITSLIQQTKEFKFIHRLDL